MVVVCRREKPLLGSKRGSRASPLSTTTRTPGNVTEDSATLVASTMRRRPSGSGASASVCCSSGNSPCSGSKRTSPAATAGSVASARRASPISRWPGRNTSRSPGSCASACSTQRRNCGSRPSSRRAGKYATDTGYERPSDDSRGASIRAASAAPSSVADITSSRRSGRSCACTSSARARPRSPARWRSWNSSKTMAATLSRVGSSWIIRVRMPSVSTSMRVAAETLFSKRMR